VKRLLPLLFLVACGHKEDPPPSPHHECVDACTTMLYRVVDEHNSKGRVVEDFLDPAAAPEVCEDFCKRYPDADTGCMYTAHTMKDATRCLSKLPD
jgi:hypothetical protein